MGDRRASWSSWDVVSLVTRTVVGAVTSVPRRQQRESYNKDAERQSTEPLSLQIEAGYNDGFDGLEHMVDWNDSPKHYLDETNTMNEYFQSRISTTPTCTTPFMTPKEHGQQPMFFDASSTKSESDTSVEDDNHADPDDQPKQLTLDPFAPVIRSKETLLIEPSPPKDKLPSQTKTPTSLPSTGNPQPMPETNTSRTHENRTTTPGESDGSSPASVFQAVLTLDYKNIISPSNTSVWATLFSSSPTFNSPTPEKGEQDATTPAPVPSHASLESVQGVSPCSTTSVAASCGTCDRKDAKSTPMRKVSTDKNSWDAIDGVETPTSAVCRANNLIEPSPFLSATSDLRSPAQRQQNAISDNHLLFVSAFDDHIEPARQDVPYKHGEYVVQATPVKAIIDEQQEKSSTQLLACVSEDQESTYSASPVVLAVKRHPSIFRSRQSITDPSIVSCVSDDASQHDSGDADCRTRPVPAPAQPTEQSLEDIVAHLQQKIAELELDNVRLRDQRMKSKKEMTLMRQEVVKLKQAHKNEKQTSSLRQKQINHGRGLLMQAQSHSKSLKDQLLHVKEESRKEKELHAIELSKIAQEKVTLVKEKEDLATRLRSLTAQNNKEEARAESLVMQLGMREDQLQLKEKQVATLEHEKSALQDDNLKLCKELERTKKEHSELQSHLDKAETDLRDAHKALEASSQTITSLEASVCSMQTKNQQTDYEVNRLQSSVLHLQSKLTNLNIDLCNVQHDNIGLQQEVDRLKDSNEEVLDLNCRLKEEGLGLQLANTKLEMEYQMMQSDYQEEQENAEALAAHFQDLEKRSSAKLEEAQADKKAATETARGLAGKARGHLHKLLTAKADSRKIKGQLHQATRDLQLANDEALRLLDCQVKDSTKMNLSSNMESIPCPEFDSHLKIVKPDSFRSYLQKVYGWDDNLVDRAILGYDQFMFLKREACDLWRGKTVIPSKYVDQVWALHVLYTEQYNAACEAFFGELARYNPEIDDAWLNEKNAQDTFKRLVDVFGGSNVDTKIWPIKEAAQGVSKEIELERMPPSVGDAVELLMDDDDLEPKRIKVQVGHKADNASHNSLECIKAGTCSPMLDLVEEKRKKRAERETRKIQSFNRSGVNDQTERYDFEPWTCARCSETNCPDECICVGCGQRRSSNRRAKNGISTWTVKKIKHSQQAKSFHVPTHFSVEDPDHIEHSRMVGESMLEAMKVARGDTRKTGTESVYMDDVVEEVGNGYTKGKVDAGFAFRYLAEKCPAGVRLNDKAKKDMVIAFLNEKLNQSPTHLDRIMGLLIVLSGEKTAYVAPPEVVEKHGYIATGSDTFDFDPFKEEATNPKSPRLEGWRKVHLKPGDVLVIPTEWLHCIRSVPGTVGVSAKFRRE